ncbi:MAG: CoA transferase [Proteobacteria bacterium]|jgi:crotonobetainyl-CoA:carnitine CoA-transferase CaiB-like acyl-CoA transferase|nr:CoA transferase [Pseudomonadota bacterium]MCC6630497.1 CoA transferase [Gammaproteobacteria bacterium]
MSLLSGKRVVALGDMAERPLGQFFASLGAAVQSMAADAAELDAAVAAADFLLDPWGLEILSDRGVSRSWIEARNPALVHVSVSPFGSGNARSRWLGAELVAAAMGGALRLTGEPDRAPVKEALEACTFHAEMAAAAGAMAAHYARGAHGQGQHVDVSIQEVAFSRNVNGALVWNFDRRKLHRVGGALNYGRATVRCIWPLADGWCFHTLMTGRFGAPANQGLSDWMDEAGLDNPLRGVDWLRYNRSTLEPATRAIWEKAIAAFFKTRTRADIRGEGRRRGINACVIESPVDVLGDPHLVAREFWAERGGIREPSRFARLVRGAPSAAPAADAAGSAQKPASTPSRGGPLAGVRILDFSWALVGSITTKILGDLGADVIKVETRTRPCLSRLDVQVSVSRADDFDDKPWFAHLNTSKRSLAIDLKRPESREVINPLLGWADAVMENFSPGTMDKLGLGYAQLSARHPAIVMASGSVYGQTGPLAAEWGVDGTGGALSGRTWMTGWADRDPLVPGAVPYGDVIVPYVLAACIAAALAQRRERGEGCHIDASMYEICVQQMRRAIVSAQQGTPPQRLGNADPDVLHQDVYPARGEDRWVAISVFDAAQRARLAEMAGGRSLADWTRDQEECALVDRLQGAGIAAGVLQDIEDLMEHDAPLRARGALVELPHPKLGPFGHVRTPITFSRDRQTPYRAPALGEHNAEILCGAAGLDERRYTELDAAGVLK